MQNVSSDQVVLTWKAGFDGGTAQRFRIRYQAKNSPDQYIADVLPSNATSFVINELKPGTEYTFSAMAFNELGESAYTDKNVSAHTTSKMTNISL